MSTTCNCETPELEKSELIAVQPKASTSTRAIDGVHSTAQFKVKHMMISNVLGKFASITCVLERDEMTSPNAKFGPPSTRIPSTPGSAIDFPSLAYSALAC